MSNKIYAGPADSGNQSPIIQEAGAEILGGNDILPGHLVAVNSVGAFQKNLYGAGNLLQQPLVALEQGSNYGATVDTPYSTQGETIKAVRVRSGEFVWVRVQNFTDISKGAGLAFAGNGKMGNSAGGANSEDLFIATGAVGEQATQEDQLVLVYRP